jgi:ABC-2 type transport system permease protein
MGTLRSELFKLRTTRATKIVVTCAVILPAAIFILTAMFAFNSGRIEDSLVSALGNYVPLTSLLLGVVGVLCSTQEYSQGTIRITLVATPSRAKVLFAKFMTMLIVAFTSSAVLVAVCLVPSQFILNNRNITFDLIDSDIRIVGAVFILTALMAELGLALGLIFKSSPGAISALLLWPTILEGLIFGLLSLATNGNLMKYAPVQGNGFRLIATYFGEDDNSWLTSLTYFSAFVAVFVLVGAALFSRRDA